MWYVNPLEILSNYYQNGNLWELRFECPCYTYFYIWDLGDINLTDIRKRNLVSFLEYNYLFQTKTSVAFDLEDCSYKMAMVWQGMSPIPEVLLEFGEKLKVLLATWEKDHASKSL